MTGAPSGIGKKQERGCRISEAQAGAGPAESVSLRDCKKLGLGLTHLSGPHPTEQVMGSGRSIQQRNFLQMSESTHGHFSGFLQKGCQWRSLDEHKGSL